MTGKAVVLDIKPGPDGVRSTRGLALRDRRAKAALVAIVGFDILPGDQRAAIQNGRLTINSNLNATATPVVFISDKAAAALLGAEPSSMTAGTAGRTVSRKRRLCAKAGCVRRTQRRRGAARIGSAECAARTSRSPRITTTLASTTHRWTTTRCVRTTASSAQWAPTARSSSRQPMKRRASPPFETVANAADHLLDHCVIHVSDWERSNAFYRDVMGAELVRAAGRLGLSLRRQAAQRARAGRQARPRWRGCRCSRATAIFASSGRGRSRTPIAHLEAHGVAVERGPMQRFGAKGAGTSVYFRDPDGSLMEFMSIGDGRA